jgi:DNA (cytosine-5)-methyltransferase 1
MTAESTLTSVGLFAGIGGIEFGLERAGFSTQLLCELDSAAQSVLGARFPGVRIESDVRALKKLPPVDLLAAGFPCQDLSQAGQTAGIGGTQSGLVDEIFRLVANRKTAPTWLLLENVSFMLRLDRGAAMEHLTTRLEELGFAWAYRVVDSRAFGVPQRRQRVILLASRTEDPRPVLFESNTDESPRDPDHASAFGFYWTEGRGGLGWAVDAVPTLKGGSTIGIPSPPAIWRVRDGKVFTPDIRDAERMQGFPADWTAAVGTDRRALAKRWKLVGNAVTTFVAEWVGKSLANSASRGQPIAGTPLSREGSWPSSAWGAAGERYAVACSMFPRDLAHPTLAEFLEHDGTLLSARATSGFLQRARAGSLRFRPGFLDALDAHRDLMLAAADGNQPSLL